MELGNSNKKYLGLSLTTWAIIAAVIILLVCKTHETFSNSIEYSNTEISTNEKVMKSTRDYIESILCLATNVECAEEV